MCSKTKDTVQDTHQTFPDPQTNCVVPAGEVQRRRAEGVQSVFQPSSNPPDGVGQGGDGAPEPGDKLFTSAAARSLNTAALISPS